MANRSLGDALSMLESSTFAIDSELVSRVLVTCRRWIDQPEVLTRARQLLTNAMRDKRADPFSIILVAEECDDRHLLGWAYYYILKHEDADWQNDTRLRQIDKRRLVAGAVALSKRWQSICDQWSIEMTQARTPSWAIFDKIDNVPVTPLAGRNRGYGSYQARPGADVKAQIERELYGFFDPEPWGL